MSEKQQTTETILLSVLRSALHGELYCPEIPVDWEAVLSLATRHSVQQVAAGAALQCPEPFCPTGQLLHRMQQICMQSLAVSQSQLYEAERLMQYFEDRQILILPVKGICTKQRYGAPELRSMGDLDLLYQPEQHRAVRTAMKELGYTGFQEGRKNDTYKLPPYITVEMHREAVTSDSKYSDYYRSVWDRAVLKDSCRFRYAMTAEDEYVFNLVHLAEHFLEGGAGVRFFMDVYVYEQMALDVQYIEAELRKLDLLRFRENVRAVAEAWFGDGAALNDVQQKLADYVLQCGVFGTKRNAAALAAQGGRAASFLRACFPDYASMRSMFPWLEKTPALLPCAWALRGWRSVRHRFDHVRRKWRLAVQGDAQLGKDLVSFYTACGL